MILIHPYAQKLRNGGRNAKNYPYWPALLAGLHDSVVQIGVAGEDALVSDFRMHLSLKDISALVQTCSLWIAVDSFLPHLAFHLHKPGVVLWSVSDPLIYGYPDNLNLLKDRSYLRAQPFGIWEQQPYNADAFVSADAALAQIRHFDPTG